MNELTWDIYCIVERKYIISPGREADHSSPASAVVKNTWIYTSIPPYVFLA
jgi:hypothetical protein